LCSTTGSWVYSLSRNMLERLDDLVAARVARWSPDGRWRISGAGGFDPVWSRDGRTLFNRSGRGVKSVAVPARARPFR
jgi:hypothetical protein